MSGPTKTGPFGIVVLERPGLAAELKALGLHSLEELSSPRHGQQVVTHRSSWVRRLRSGPGDLFVKTYDYPKARDVLRGIGRTTVLAPSRARREARALAWLRRHGFEAPEPLGCYEARRLGVLRRAVLVTRAWPGEPLDRLLPTLAEAERDAVLVALEEFVTRLHEAGFRDRNLDLRNVLAARRGARWVLAKIDSPRFRLRRPGRTRDRLARADWERLARSLDAALPATPPRSRP